ncbi:MAG TPA: rhomboid family intramembrane serine protease [Rudaea sp.]|nr:rhomboid family intramembrane serine protease [Rudaea sp.]
MTITIIIIAITCVVSFFAFKDQMLMQRLILWPPAVKRSREYWRLVSYGLVHADGQHLLFNMLTLYFFGQFVEQTFEPAIGEIGYVLFYIGGLLASILPSYAKNENNPNYRSLGASGAVSAIVFAFILMNPWAQIYFYFFPMPAIIYAALYIGYSVYMDHSGRGNVNHSAHLWGAAYGVAFTLVMEPSRFSAFFRALGHPS